MKRRGAGKQRAVAALVTMLCWTAAARADEQSQVPSNTPNGAASDDGRETAAGGQPGPKVVEEGLFPKSIHIPGTDVSLSIGGYVKVDFIQDFGPIQDAFEFRTNSIPADGSAAAAQSGLTTIHARETRFNVDLRSHAAAQPFRAFVEGDFFGSGNAFRLRHGFGEFGHLLGGQTWTTFMDISARPLTLDFEGPEGELFVRQAMIRWQQASAPHWTWAVAVESPSPQFAIPSGLSGTARSNVPDIPGFVRYEASRGHVQVSGLLRQLRFDGGQDVENVSELGWGVNTTFTMRTLGQDAVQAQFMIGEGMARYIEGLIGQNLDAVLTPTGELTPLRTQGGVIGYTHFWRSDLKSGISYSTASVEDEDSLAVSAIDRLQDFRLNLIYTPYRLVDVGGEVLWGQRANKDGTDGDSWRFQFALIYRFN